MGQETRKRFLQQNLGFSSIKTETSFLSAQSYSDRSLSSASTRSGTGDVFLLKCYFDEIMMRCKQKFRYLKLALLRFQPNFLVETELDERHPV